MLGRLIYFTLVLCSIFYSDVIRGQGILISDSSGTPDPSAILEMRSNNKGFLVTRMSETERNNINSPSKGLLIYQTDGIEGFYYYEGSQWEALDGKSSINSITEVSNSSIAVVRDLKGSGVDGGTFNSGSWIKRDLNDLQGDSSFISINNDSTFTLDSGIYEVSIIAPGRSVGVHQVRLFNNTDNLVTAIGTAVNSATASTTSEIYSVFTINKTTEFIVQHQCTLTENTDGFGSGTSWGTNVYTQVKIQKY